MHKVRRLTMYLKLFIIFYKLLLFGAREGGQARPDYKNDESAVTRLRLE